MRVLIILVVSLASASASESEDMSVLERIRALETRDAEHSARISTLEDYVRIAESKIVSLSSDNRVLRKTLIVHTMKLRQKDNLIGQLRVDVSENNKMLNKLNLLIGQLNSVDSNNVPLKETVMEIEHTEKNEGERDQRSTNEDTRTRDCPDIRCSKKSTQRIEKGRRYLTDTVAFQAVLGGLVAIHPDVGYGIEFPDTLLNVGNGYHSQHGLFTAPKAGIYLFSATLTICYGSQELQASIVKNNIQISRIHARNSDDEPYDQSSTVAVMQLSVGDEVWVRFDHRPNTPIWANGFTSFAGVLIFPL